eukprot:8634980-Pyramimonas_sp.AAC.1
MGGSTEHDTHSNSVPQTAKRWVSCRVAGGEGSRSLWACSVCQQSGGYGSPDYVDGDGCVIVHE